MLFLILSVLVVFSGVLAGMTYHTENAYLRTQYIGMLWFCIGAIICVPIIWTLTENQKCETKLAEISNVDTVEQPLPAAQGTQ